MAEGRRKHLEGKVTRWSGYGDAEDYEITTERGRSPHTLVITKMMETFHKAHSDWRSRRDRAKQQISRIAQPGELRLVLGDAYDELTSVSASTLPRTVEAAGLEPNGQSFSRVPLAAPLNQPAASISPSTSIANKANNAGQDQSLKRKHAPMGNDDVRSKKRAMKSEVIDLCSSP